MMCVVQTLSLAISCEVENLLPSCVIMKERLLCCHHVSLCASTEFFFNEQYLGGFVLIITLVINGHVHIWLHATSFCCCISVVLLVVALSSRGKITIQSRSKNKPILPGNGTHETKMRMTNVTIPEKGSEVANCISLLSFIDHSFTGRRSLQCYIFNFETRKLLSLCIIFLKQWSHVEHSYIVSKSLECTI